MQKWVDGVHVDAGSVLASFAFFFLDVGSYPTLQPKVRGWNSGQGELPTRYGPPESHSAHGRAESMFFAGASEVDHDSGGTPGRNSLSA